MKNRKDDYIRFEVATYALPLVICALNENGVTNFSVTQEDYNLVISINADYLENICYGAKVNVLENNKEVEEEK